MNEAAAMRWCAWGERETRLDESLVTELGLRLGRPLAATSQPVALEDVDTQPGSLSGPEIDGLRALLGPRLLVSTYERIHRCAGRSYLDLLRLRSGHPDGLPDAVAEVESEEEIVAVIGYCTDHDIAVVPFGGGTSVVGGVRPMRGDHHAVVSLDCRRMRSLLRLHPMSQLAVVEPGLRAGELEELTARWDLELGHYPQSFEFATLGGYAATRSAGQASTGVGRFDDLVAGLRLVTPRGVIALAAETKSAVGPDLRQVVLGSEGTIGVISQLTLRLRRMPPARWYEAWSFPSFECGYSAFRGLIQRGVVPDVARLSDPAETDVNLIMSGQARMTGLLRSYLKRRGQPQPCMAIIGYEGSVESVNGRRADARSIVRDSEGIWLGRSAAEAWRRHRFSSPYLRDPMLDHGLLVETLETSALWDDLHAVRRAVNGALMDTLATPESRPLVGCHVSHLYSHGASLYFTVIGLQNGSPIEQWQRAKAAACEAIRGSGGTLTHHHAVGVDHLPFVEAEWSPLGAAALRAVKRELDPSGIMNPGKLLPESAAVGSMAGS